MDVDWQKVDWQKVDWEKVGEVLGYVAAGVGTALFGLLSRRKGVASKSDLEVTDDIVKQQNLVLAKLTERIEVLTLLQLEMYRDLQTEVQRRALGDAELAGLVGYVRGEASRPAAPASAVDLQAVTRRDPTPWPPLPLEIYEHRAAEVRRRALERGRPAPLVKPLRRPARAGGIGEDAETPVIR